MTEFSLNKDVINRIFADAKPLGHHSDPGRLNLGFGFLYYGVVRTIRPKHVLVIGSGYGFSVVYLALALRDNGNGKVTFIDPSYSILKDGPRKTIGGRGTWDTPKAVLDHFNIFDVSEMVTHYKMTSEEFFAQFENNKLPVINLAFIDGNHSYENVRFDFIETFKHSRNNTYIFLHDTNIYVREFIRNSGVKRWVQLLKRNPHFELLNFPYSSGVAVARVLKEDAWKHLTD